MVVPLTVNGYLQYFRYMCGEEGAEICFKVPESPYLLGYRGINTSSSTDFFILRTTMFTKSY